ncbi:MAG: hypothetical protein H7X77_05155 [Anaerolineae bacterium]|nr:hypothetical protein [Anaerolineae bacterium]
MNQNYVEYHLHHKHEDLMQEREQDRLAALATIEQKPGMLRRWLTKSTQVANDLVKTETPPTSCPDVRLA